MEQMRICNCGNKDLGWGDQCLHCDGYTWEWYKNHQARSNKQETEDFKENKSKIIGIVDELMAVTELEYHNKNWLSGNDGSRNRSKTRTLEEIRNQLINLKR